MEAHVAEVEERTRTTQSECSSLVQSHAEQHRALQEQLEKANEQRDELVSRAELLSKQLQTAENDARNRESALTSRVQQV